LAVLVLIQISYSHPHALLEYSQGIHPHPFTPSSTRWETMGIWEYGDDAPTPPHIIATTINGIEGNNTQLLRGELLPILQLMVNRMGEEGHENDAIIPVSSIPLHVLFLTRTRYCYFQSCQLDVVGYC
jgi:hypothetical protein